MRFYHGGNQRDPEIHTWVSLCLGMGIKSYVELGCGSAYLLQQAGVHIVTVDLLANGQTNHLVANSQDPETVSRVLAMLGEKPDVVFIDADHETDGVRRDFELWWPVAKVMVGFHDILMPSVMPFWNDICLGIRSAQIIARDLASADKWQHGGNHPDGRVNCGGIGILFKEEE